jgi:uncharacterized cupredoxin-like copper-binding protein
MTARYPAVAALAATACLSFAACGGDDEGDGGGGTSGSPVATVNVSESEFKLDPANPSVDKAGTVEINATNDGKITHALEVEGPNGEKEIEDIEPGQSKSLRVDLGKAGKYEWYCPIDGHKDKGMKGEITVAGGGGASSSSGDDDTKKDDGGSRYGY